MSDTTLFSDLKFNVSASHESSEKLRGLILSHGGLLTDKSDDYTSSVFVVDAFEQNEARFAIARVSLPFSVEFPFLRLSWNSLPQSLRSSLIFFILISFILNDF